MAAKRKRKHKTAALIVSVALLTGSIYQPGYEVQKIYAEEPKVIGELKAEEETETQEETEQLAETDVPEETEILEETEVPEESEQLKESEIPDESEQPGEKDNTEELEQPEETEVLEETEQTDEMESPDEPGQPGEKEFPENMEQPGETEFPEETEQPDESELPEETEHPEETQVSDELEQSIETEVPEKSEQSDETELMGESTGIVEEIESETGFETELESEIETETEMETESETEPDSQLEMTQQDPCASSSDCNTYWDESWYVEKDFRFVQVEKEYGIIEGGEAAAVYETPDTGAEIVGEIPYFGIAYVLKEENNQWLYIESGDVRGFIQKEYLADEYYTDILIGAIGEESFQLAQICCEKADNEAFVYTHTTVQEVLVPKQYSLVIKSCYIQEYPETSARNIGKISSGNLVYLLEETENGWFFVESGDSRGFIRKEMLLSGAAAEEMVSMLGEEAVALAETYIQPEENRSCYFTLTSVKSAESGKGEKIAELALSFAGKLPYVWGGTSLSYGADCSGFVQSVYAACGINLPRLAEEQGISGEEVQSISEAQPGDVVYWADGPHVGIYIGNGQVVQCSGNSSNTAANPGKGVTISAIDYRPITSIRRFQIEAEWYADSAGERVDQTPYSQEQMELIWAIVAQEDNGSYAGALAVISSAMNRTESSLWGYHGNNALSQLTAPGQYCYSMDNYWKPRLGGNVPEYVKQAVNDCLKKGIRNHSFTSFRSTKGSQTGEDAVQIGGNWFFGS